MDKVLIFFVRFKQHFHALLAHIKKRSRQMFEYEGFCVKKVFCISPTKHVNCNNDDNFQGKYLPSFYLWLLYKGKKEVFVYLSLFFFVLSPFTWEEIKLQLFWSEEIIRCFFLRKLWRETFFYEALVFH